MMPTQRSWARMIALVHQPYPAALLRRAMARMPAMPVDRGWLVGHYGAWWGPVVPLGADRFDVDAAGGWAVLLPVYRAAAWWGGPLAADWSEWRVEPEDMVDVLALPLWGEAEAEPRGWGGRRWRRFLGAADLLCPWAVEAGLDAGTGPDGEAPEVRLFREPWGWLEAGAPLERAAVVLRWSREVLGALGQCRPIGEDQAHAEEIARRLREHALAGLPAVRFPRRMAA